MGNLSCSSCTCNEREKEIKIEPEISEDSLNNSSRMRKAQASEVPESIMNLDEISNDVSSLIMIQSL